MSLKSRAISPLYKSGSNMTINCHVRRPEEFIFKASEIHANALPVRYLIFMSLQPKYRRSSLFLVVSHMHILLSVVVSYVFVVFYVFLPRRKSNLIGHSLVAEEFPFAFANVVRPRHDAPYFRMRQWNKCCYIMYT